MKAQGIIHRYKIGLVQPDRRQAYPLNRISKCPRQARAALASSHVSHKSMQRSGPLMKPLTPRCEQTPNKYPR
jgi:hypothetical protein